MAYFKVLARLRGALEKSPATPPEHHPSPPASEPRGPLPTAITTHRAELVSLFTREFQALGGHVIQAGSAAEAAGKIVEIARHTGAGQAMLGRGVLIDFSLISRELEQHEISVLNVKPVDSDEARTQMRDEVARCPLGVAEADYAVAASGTLALLANAERPGVLTLLPPACVILIQASRLMKDLASTMAALGGSLPANRLHLITGPSRTADIEKRLVIGVHGPKDLYALIVWPQDSDNS